MRIKRKYCACLIAAIVAALIAVFVAIAPAASPVYAAGAYDMEIALFDVTYDVHSDRTIDVEERVTINYTGWSNTGFIRDLPVNAGDRVYDIDVKELNASGAEVDVDYSVSIEDELAMVDIGDTSLKSGQTCTYIIRYVFAITRPTNDNAIYLNIVGFGSEAPILESDITINLPDGFLFDSQYTQLYVGDTTHKDLMVYDSATNSISVSLSGLDEFEGATADLYFEDGALSTRFDITPYIMVIAGCILLAILVAVKFLVFPRKPLTPVVSFEAPDGMDPVEISKLIDNKVDSTDVTTMIFYWASKGYLKIDLSDEDDPELIRIYRELPAGAPKHQVVMYNALFAGGDMIKISSLEGKFYTTVERVRKLVNEKYRGMYTTKSVCVSLIFTLIGGLLMALAPIITGMVSINSTLFYYPAFLALVPAFVIYGVTETYAYAIHKNKKSTKALMIAGIVALCALFTALYVWLLPSAILEIAPKILVCAVAYAVVIVSVTLISRTEDYTNKLNGIIGFKNFILYTEKDKLEVMIKEDPEFYYKILPYAQVMGVSDVWEDKFKDLTVQPPRWISDPVGTYVSFALINRAVRLSSATMTTRMVARPSAPSSRSYSGGGRHSGGGSFGGRSGGGHGGGGFRGR